MHDWSELPPPWLLAGVALAAMLATLAAGGAVRLP
jgi:hypothetical protein